MPVVLKNATELRKALKQFTPDLGKETTKEIGLVLKPIVSRARGFAPAIPLSHWTQPVSKGRYSYNLMDVRRGIGFKTTPSKPNRRGFVALAQIRNRSAAGAVYETAGRKSGMVGNFSPRLGELTKSDAGTGRLIYKAWEENHGKATAAVVKAIETAAAKLNARAK